MTACCLLPLANPLVPLGVWVVFFLFVYLFIFLFSFGRYCKVVMVTMESVLIAMVRLVLFYECVLKGWAKYALIKLAQYKCINAVYSILVETSLPHTLTIIEFL